MKYGFIEVFLYSLPVVIQPDFYIFVLRLCMKESLKHLSGKTCLVLEYIYIVRQNICIILFLINSLYFKVTNVLIILKWDVHMSDHYCKLYMVLYMNKEWIFQFILLIFPSETVCAKRQVIDYDHYFSCFSFCVLNSFLPRCTAPNVWSLSRDILEFNGTYCNHSEWIIQSKAHDRSG
jgi:hypothetical protein